jgi:hypothetical protein
MKRNVGLRILMVMGLGMLSWLATLLAPVAVQAANPTWRGEYFTNSTLSGAPGVVRYDEKIDFRWRSGSPVRNVPADGFSVRWTGEVRLNAGRYGFRTETDDGVRLYVDGKLVIDRWYDMATSVHTAVVPLKAGLHTIRMEYYENRGEATAKLTWQEIVTNGGGNIITCVRPTNSWIKVYRLEGTQWVDIQPKGFGAMSPAGNLKLDGLAVDMLRYGSAGHPYRVELWADGSLIRAVGDTANGQPAFRVYPDRDSYTPWGCPAP